MNEILNVSEQFKEFDLTEVQEVLNVSEQFKEFDLTEVQEVQEVQDVQEVLNVSEQFKEFDLTEVQEVQDVQEVQVTILEPKTLLEYTNIISLYSNYIIVDFYGPWCKPCKKILPTYIKLANKYSHMTFVKVNVTEPDFADILSAMNVKKLPSFGVIKDNKLLNLLVGPDMEVLECELMIRSC
jgi:thiol-disulfide isomerase/thioredoxin